MIKYRKTFAFLHINMCIHFPSHSYGKPEEQYACKLSVSVQSHKMELSSSCSPFLNRAVRTGVFRLAQRWHGSAPLEGVSTRASSPAGSDPAERFGRCRASASAEGLQEEGLGSHLSVLLWIGAQAPSTAAEPALAWQPSTRGRGEGWVQHPRHFWVGSSRALPELLPGAVRGKRGGMLLVLLEITSEQSQYTSTAVYSLCPAFLQAVCLEPCFLYLEIPLGYFRPSLIFLFLSRFETI